MSNQLDKYQFDPLAEFAFEQISGTGTAVGFTAATAANAKLAVVTVETGPIRIREDGTAPTITVGTLYNAGDQFQVYGSENLKNFSFILATAGAAAIDCEYYR